MKTLNLTIVVALMLLLSSVQPIVGLNPKRTKRIEQKQLSKEDEKAIKANKKLLTKQKNQKLFTNKVPSLKGKRTDTQKKRVAYILAVHNIFLWHSSNGKNMQKWSDIENDYEHILKDTLFARSKKHKNNRNPYVNSKKQAEFIEKLMLKVDFVKKVIGNLPAKIEEKRDTIYLPDSELARRNFKVLPINQFLKNVEENTDYIRDKFYYYPKGTVDAATTSSRKQYQIVKKIHRADSLLTTVKNSTENFVEARDILLELQKSGVSHYLPTETIIWINENVYKKHKLLETKLNNEFGNRRR